MLKPLLNLSVFSGSTTQKNVKKHSNDKCGILTGCGKPRMRSKSPVGNGPTDGVPTAGQTGREGVPQPDVPGAGDAE